MKSEPKIGDVVWAYLDDTLLELVVADYAPNVDHLCGTASGRHFKLVLKDGYGDVYLATKNFFPTARDTINDCIRYTNDLIRGNKKELEQTRRKIKELKNKRAAFQRMLNKFPKQP